MAVNVLVPMTLDEVQELRRTLSVLEAPHRVGPEMEAECRELARKWHRELDARWIEPATHTGDVEKLDALIGLHEGIEIIYVVDGYEASLTGHDGATTLLSAQGPTVMAALTALAALAARSGKGGGE